MVQFLLRRVLATIVVLWIVSVVAFVLLRLAPGDPAKLVAGPLASPEAVARVRDEMGLNHSVPVQYWNYLSDLLHGNFGMAWHVHLPVSHVFAERLPATIELAITAAVAALIVAVILGAFAAYHPNGIVDRLVSGFAVIGLGTPVFWIGLVFIEVFFFRLHAVPAPIGQLSPGVAAPAPITGAVVVDALLRGQWSTFGNAVEHLVLPAATLAIPACAYLTQIIRQAVVDTYREDYIDLLRAKGVPEVRILSGHALRNALLPVLTLVALAIGDLLSGSVLVEAAFSWPGVGGFVAESISAQDFAPVEAAVVLGAVVYSILNLVTDLLYGLVDPRVRVAEPRERRSIRGRARAPVAGAGAADA